MNSDGPYRYRNDDDSNLDKVFLGTAVTDYNPQTNTDVGEFHYSDDQTDEGIRWKGSVSVNKLLAPKVLISP